MTYAKGDPGARTRAGRARYARLGALNLPPLPEVCSEPPRLSFVLPIPTLSQNVYQRLHWAKQSRHKQDLALLVRNAVQLAGGLSALPPLDLEGPHVTLLLTRFGSRRLDFGNLVGGAKPLLDALVSEGLLRDDSPRWLSENYRQDLDSKNQRTLVQLWW